MKPVIAKVQDLAAAAGAINTDNPDMQRAIAVSLAIVRQWQEADAYLEAKGQPLEDGAGNLVPLVERIKALVGDKDDDAPDNAARPSGN